MGYTHAMTGAMGWLIAAPAASMALDRPLTPGELATGTLVCAGAALVPDLDHPQATVARTFGPPSQAFAKFVAMVSGGHRHGTHTLLFAILFGGFCQLMAFLGGWFAWGISFMLIAFAIRGLHLVPPRVGGWKTLFVLVEAGAIVYSLNHWTSVGWWWLGIAGFWGCFIHCTGDSCTPERVPWLLPFTKKRFGVGLISHTGNTMEVRVLAPICGLITIWLLYIRFWDLIPWPWT